MKVPLQKRKKERKKKKRKIEERKVVQDYMDEWMAKYAATAKVEISREETNFK